MASEQLLEEKSAAVETNAAVDEGPSMYGSNDSMWDLGQDEVDKVQDYTYTDNYGKTSTYHFNIIKPKATSDSIKDIPKHVNTKDAVIEDLHDVKQPEKATKAGSFQPTNEVSLPGKQKPSSLSELGKSGAGTKYTKAGGTLDNPDIKNDLYEGCLFINGQTYAEDIRQNNIGDCYFLAALLSIIHADPTFIPKIMSFKDGRVRTMLYHREGYDWVARPVETEYGVMNNTGSYHRVAYDPKESIWSAGVEKNTLRVTRKDMYEAAVWVNLMEQAFIYYAKLYGQYGEDMNAADKESRNGHELITGGWGSYCVRMLLGGETVVKGCQTCKTHTNEQSMLENCRPLVTDLIKLAMTQGGDKKENTFLCLAAIQEDIAPRSYFYAKSLVDELEAEIDFGDDGPQLEQLKEALEVARDMESCLKVYSSGRSSTSTAGAGVSKQLSADIKKLANNEALKALNSPNFLSLRSIMGTFNGGDGNFYMVMKHAYNVARITLKDKEGKDIVVDNSMTFDTFADMVDLDKSSVVLENPWGHGHGTLAGNKATRSEEGCFESSLRECLASVTHYSCAVGKNFNNENNDNAESIMGAAIFKQTASSNSSGSSSSSSDKGKSYTYEYWESGNGLNDKAKGDVIHESDADKDYNAQGGKAEVGHRTNHEDFFTDTDKGIMLDDNNNAMTPSGSSMSQAKHNNKTGKKYDVTAGVRTNGTPAPRQLYYESANGLEVDYFRGSLKDPNISKDIEKNSLFIDGMPAVRDVIQNNIGDCYFLSAVLHVLNTEPERIRDMMRITDGKVDVAFFHKNSDGISWSPVHIRSEWGASVMKNGQAAGVVVGSKVRIDNKTHGTPLWQAQYDPSVKSLNITRKDMYQAAMWVQALENAYSIFAAKSEYGPYGDGTKETSRTEDITSVGGRYGEIHFGDESKCLRLFFGSRVTGSARSNNSVKDDGLMKGNDAIYQALLNFCNAGETPELGFINHNSSALVASLSADSALSRLQTLSKKVLNEVSKSSDASVKATAPIFTTINNIANTRGIQMGDSNLQNQLNNQCVSLVADHNDALSKISSWHLLRNAIGTYVDLAHNRSVSYGHAYNVKSVVLRDNKGAEIKTTNLKDLKKRLDIRQSEVVLQNPHGTNRQSFDPRAGDAATDVKDTFGGDFQMTLEEFMWSTDILSETKVFYKTVNRPY